MLSHVRFVVKGEEGGDVKIPHSLRLCSTFSRRAEEGGKLDEKNVLLSRSVQEAGGAELDGRIDGAHERT